MYITVTSLYSGQAGVISSLKLFVELALNVHMEYSSIFGWHYWLLIKLRSREQKFAGIACALFHHWIWRCGHSPDLVWEEKVINELHVVLLGGGGGGGNGGHTNNNQ